jgi:hypothetical protein
MKKFLLLGGSLFLYVCIMAQTPVAYYPFSGNANDAIGTLNGTVNGAALTSDRFGKANSAYSFDGTGANINLSNSNALRPVTAITISAWVFLQHPNASVLGNSVISCSDDAGYNITFFEPNQIEFSVRRNNSDASVITDASAYFNAWHFVAGTYDGRFAKLYIDGILKATNDAGAVFPIQYSATANTYIGVEPGPSFSIDPNFNYLGAIDEVKIYNTALSALKIQQEYASSGQIQKPGSGNAISFDGVTQSVSIPNSTASNFGTGNFSVEFWFNSTGTTRDEILISKRDDGCGDGQLWGLYKTPAGAVYLEMHNPGNINQRISIPNVLDGKWHHLSFVRNGTQLSGYKDGIQVDNNTATPINVNNSAALTIGTGACAPFISGGGLFEGKVDEFKIWNIALTQSEIRDRMCHKITSDDPLYSNLTAYYNFDESIGATVFDGTVNANNGTLINNPARVTSGAPIGNASNHDYVNAIKTTSISHSTGESFTVTSSSGNPDGIHVYRVDEQPNTLSGASGVGSNDKYFGVFQVNGTTPQYNAVCNYNGNPFVNAGIESQLRLNKRADNAAGNWSIIPAIPDEPNNTITVFGESTEYILGRLGGSLPLNLIFFNGTVQNDIALLSWKTSNENNTETFELQNSNGTAAFTAIALVKAKQLSNGADYNAVYQHPFVTGNVQYYRLKIIDHNGMFKYSSIIRLSNTSLSQGLSIFPNPAGETVAISSDEKQDVVITNSNGQVMQKISLIKGSQTIYIGRLAAGIYFMRGETAVIKLIKQ